MTWDEFIERHRAALEANWGYELLFVQTVLSRVKGLDPSNVEPQFAFRDVKGRERRIDFAIRESAALPIALEVDGFDKTGSGGWTPVQYEDFMVRQSSLTQQGWQVLRFANSTVKRSPALCIALIERTLANTREMQRTLMKAEQQHAISSADAAIWTARSADLRREVNHILGNLDEDESLQQGLPPGVEMFVPRFEDLRTRTEQSIGGLRHGLRLQAVAVAALAAVLAFVVWKLWFDTNATRRTGPPQRVQATIAEGSQAQSQIVEANQAQSHVGAYAKVCGRVAETRWDSTGRRQYTFLNFDNPYPYQTFSARLPASLRSVVNTDLVGRRVCVSGAIEEYRDRPTMLVTRAEDLVVVGRSR